MTVSPQSIRSQQFKTTRKGYDQGEVDEFRTQVADALESAQNEATAMEARARAAVARLQEMSRAQTDQTDQASPVEAALTEAATEPTPVARREITPSLDQAETISRTLLLAQRTADTTVADAQAEADRLLTAALAQSTATADAARVEREQLIAAAQDEARRAGESERARVEGEVQALLARRDFLESDVDHLEQFIAAQRERLTEAAAAISGVVARVPDGLADMRRPLLSAADDSSSGAVETTTSTTSAGDDEGGDIAAITRIAAQTDDQDVADETGDIWAPRRGADGDATPAATERLFPPADDGR